LSEVSTDSLQTRNFYIKRAACYHAQPNTCGRDKECIQIAVKPKQNIKAAAAATKSNSSYMSNYTENIATTSLHYAKKTLQINLFNVNILYLLHKK